MAIFSCVLLSAVFYHFKNSYLYKMLHLVYKEMHYKVRVHVSHCAEPEAIWFDGREPADATDAVEFHDGRTKKKKPGKAARRR